MIKMAGKKAAKVTLLTSLAAIVLAGEAGGSAHRDVFADLAGAGLVEVVSYDEVSFVGVVKATPAGIAQYQASLPPVFEIEADVEMPTIVRGRATKASIYPFDKLEVGQSFFVSDSVFDKDGEKGSAAKSMNSTTSTANRRYSEVIPGEFTTNKKGESVPATRQLRKFVCREFKHETKGPGARIWRIEV